MLEMFEATERGQTITASMSVHVSEGNAGDFSVLRQLSSLVDYDRTVHCRYTLEDDH